MAALERRQLADLIDYLGMPILSIKHDELTKWSSSPSSSNTSNTTQPNATTFAKSGFSDDERRIVCDSLFYLINWLVELINAFSCLITAATSKDDSEPLNRKLVSRLATVCELHAVLASVLPCVRYYRPPLAVFGLIDTAAIHELPFTHALVSSAAASASSATASKRGRKKADAKKLPSSKKIKLDKAKKQTTAAAADDDETATSDKENDAEADTVAAAAAAAGDDEDNVWNDEKELVDDDDDDESGDITNNKDAQQQTINLSDERLAIYFRDFDLNVLRFVNVKLALTADADADADADDDEVQMAPSLLSFVLADVHRKLALVLKTTASTSPFAAAAAASSAASSGVGGGGGKLPSKQQLFMQLNVFATGTQVAAFVVDECLASMCRHMDAIVAYVRAIHAAHDGVKDSTQMCNSAHNVSLLRCLADMLRIVYVLFAWLAKNSSSSSSGSSNASRNMSLVVKMIKVMSQSGGVAATADEASRAPEVFCFKYLSELKEVVLDLATADLLAKTLDLLCNTVFVKQRRVPANYEAKCRQLLAATCAQFLQNDYSARMHQALGVSKQASNEAVSNMLHTLLRNEKKRPPLDLCEKMSRVITSDAFASDRSACGSFNTLKGHLAPYYKVNSFILYMYIPISLKILNQVEKTEF